MDSWEGTYELLVKLLVSWGLGGSAAATMGVGEGNLPQECPGLGAGGLTPVPPQESLSCCLRDASNTSRASWLHQSQVCHAVLQMCIERLAEPRCCPAHITSLVAVAEAVCHGYLATMLQPAPLYLDSVLYELLRNVAGQGSVMPAGGWPRGQA